MTGRAAGLCRRRQARAVVYREGLIAEVTLTLVPVLIGEGIRLFGPLETDVELDLTGVKKFPSGLLTTTCRIR